mgnify:CR=1 FL=1
MTTNNGTYSLRVGAGSLSEAGDLTLNLYYSRTDNDRFMVMRPLHLPGSGQSMTDGDGQEIAAQVPGDLHQAQVDLAHEIMLAIGDMAASGELDL